MTFAWKNNYMCKNTALSDPAQRYISHTMSAGLLGKVLKNNIRGLVMKMQAYSIRFKMMARFMWSIWSSKDDTICLLKCIWFFILQGKYHEAHEKNISRSIILNQVESTHFTWWACTLDFHFNSSYGLIQYKDYVLQYRNSHWGDKVILWLSYLYNVISYTDRMNYLYWIKTQSILEELDQYFVFKVKEF